MAKSCLHPVCIECNGPLCDCTESKPGRMVGHYSVGCHHYCILCWEPARETRILRKPNTGGIS